MSDAEGMVAVLLAAGRSRRFGGNKLAAPIHGEPLIHHAAQALRRVGFSSLLVVANRDTPDLQAFGFRRIVPSGSRSSLSASIACGVEAARRLAAKSVLIALADMPFVPTAHFERMRDAFSGDRVATSVDGVLQPPAIFGQAWLEPLTALEGDVGARRLLAGSMAIELSSRSARDIDTMQDLAAAGQDVVMTRPT